MTDLTPIECEARLVGLSKQRRKDGDWIEVKFHIHPDDHPAALFILPLGTDCTLSIKGVTASEAPAETERPSTTEPVAQPGVEHRPWTELPPTQQAGIACNDPAFQRWICLKNGCRPSEDGAARIVRQDCGVGSRSELNTCADLAGRWYQIYAEYQAAQQGRTDAALMEQRR